MLEEVSIVDLGIIEKATLKFSSGLTVLTGETGAGKTMILTGLHLLLGKRAAGSIVKEGVGQASVEGVWQLKNEKLVQRIEDTGALVEDGQVFVNRTVKPDGKSRAVLGGKSVPAGKLAEIGNSLVNIHGQADQMRLKTPAAQLSALDRFAANLEPKKKAYQKLYTEWTELKKRLKDISTNVAVREFEFQQLSALEKDLAELGPRPGELVELEQTANTLANLESIKEGLSYATGMLFPEDYDAQGPADSLSAGLKQLNGIVSFDPQLQAIAELGSEAQAALGVFLDELESYAQSMDEESMELLYSTQDRIQELKTFSRRHKISPEEAIDTSDARRQRMAELDPATHSVEALEEELATVKDSLLGAGLKLSAARKKAALLLASRVNDELAGLAMGGNEFSISFKEITPGSQGIDELEFQLTYGGSSTARPIAKTASGGELSRIMLALEVVLADPAETPTFVFDEVDSGVGGATAIEIGRRLAKLALEAQVVVVSHLPQIAAYADQHLYVKKTRGATAVKTLGGEERIAEVARMLSGKTESESGRAHARELIDSAEQEKAEEKVDIAS